MSTFNKTRAAYDSITGFAAILILRGAFGGASFETFPFIIALILVAVALAVPVILQFSEPFDETQMKTFLGTEAAFHILSWLALIPQLGFWQATALLAFMLFIQYRSLIWLLF